MSEPHARAVFLERLAHDLRSAAATGSGALDELDRAASPDEARRFAAIARRGYQRILRVTLLLVETAELERGKPNLSRARCVLAPLVESAIADALSLENRRGVDLTREIPEELVVEVDGARMARVVFELISYAIRVARSQVIVSANPSGDTVALSVRDDGDPRPPIGGAASPTSTSCGSTLGLTMAVDVVAAHGGKLELSREGQITRVTVTLPRG